MKPVCASKHSILAPFCDKFYQYSENVLTQGMFLNCKTNNADESVNGFILHRCQKVFLSGRNSVEIAAANNFLFGLMMFLFLSLPFWIRFTVCNSYYSIASSDKDT